VTGEAEVTKRQPGRRPPGGPVTLSPIPSNGFWSKWRRDGDGPQSLEQLLKQVEKGTQVRHSRLDRALEELQAHRDAASAADLRSALTWLCNAQTRMAKEPTPAHSRDVLLAIYEVRRVLATTGNTPR
jgi:hypothetical protein